MASTALAEEEEVHIEEVDVDPDYNPAGEAFGLLTVLYAAL